MPNKVLIQDAEDISLTNHNEVDQILGNPPSWILRWGITLVFVAVIIFAMIAWLIKYPDVISAKVSIVTENPAIRVVARSSGKIKKLLVDNEKAIQKGMTLAILDNPAKLEDVKKLESFIEEKGKLRAPKEFLKITPSNDLVLGALQTSYASLVQKINDYRYFLNRDGVFEKTQSLEARIKHTEQLNQNLYNQKQTLTHEADLAQKDFLRNKELNKIGSVSDAQLEKSETQFLQYNRQMEGLSNQIINNNISIEQIKTQIADLKLNRADSQSDKTLNINQNLQSIQSEIDLWKQTYLITAPIAGKVVFSKIWSEQQFVNTNEEILTIVPSEGTGKIIGKAILPIANSGKVKKGQVANIRLDGFPFQEYGIIKGKVTSISLVPVVISNQQPEESYLLNIDLPKKLITSYEKEIPFRQEMQGTANIITEDRRVLERIFDRVNNILKNS